MNSLPPLNPLKAFEAAARHCSLTLAAEEMNVSQVAISRQVKVLEDYFEVTLFRRMHRGIELTEEGKHLYEGITKAFLDISNAARRVSRRGRRDILAIQSYTTFSQRWLIPRLTDFHDKHPQIEVRLSSSTAPVDFTTQNLDAAIRSGCGKWEDLNFEKLADMELIPICSPKLKQCANLESIDQLANVRLLHSMARPNDWASWLSHVDANIDPKPGIRFENSALAYEAASLDIGVAIAIKKFVQHHIQSGSIIAPFPQAHKIAESYYITWPKTRTPSKPLQKFLNWLRESMEDELNT